MRQDSEDALSVLKSNSFVLKWKRVVSVLSPFSLFSHGGSHIQAIVLSFVEQFPMMQLVSEGHKPFEVGEIFYLLFRVFCWIKF